MTRSVKYLLKTFQADENLNRVTQNHDELSHRTPCFPLIVKSLIGSKI
jgi:hypothetical protein